MTVPIVRAKVFNIAATPNKYTVMKIRSIISERSHNTITEKKSNVIHFHGDYSHGYGVQNFDGMPVDSSYEEEIEFAQDEYGISGKEVQPGTWVGWKFDEPEYDGNELLMTGEVCVITDHPMEDDDPFFQKVFAAVEKDANQVIQS